MEPDVQPASASFPARVVGSAAWAGTVMVLSTYALSALTGNALPFHWANALGGIPLIAVQIRGRVFQPMVVTAAFTIIGWVGIISHYWGR